MSDDVIRIDIYKLVRKVGMDEKNPWKEYEFEDAQAFLSEVSDILRSNPNATEVYIFGLLPVEIAMSISWMIGQAGLKPKYARPHCYLMDLPIPYGAYYESEELGFA